MCVTHFGIFNFILIIKLYSHVGPMLLILELTSIVTVAALILTLTKRQTFL